MSTDIDTDRINKALGIETETITAFEPSANLPVQHMPKRDPVPIQETGNKIEDDSEYARQNLYDVLTKTSESIDQLTGELSMKFFFLYIFLYTYL